MEKELLENLISQGLSTYEIASKVGKGQTTARYWLRKYGLNTQNLSQLKDLKNIPNGKKCLSCDKPLVGAKSHYCSNTCKASTSYYSQPNTNERQKKVSKERKLKLIEMSGGGCNICGYNKNYSALQFHHLDRSNKVFCLDSRKLSNTNWDSILEEWQKCQLLCATCHIEVHNPDNLIV